MIVKQRDVVTKASRLIEAMEELQKVAADAGKPCLLWAVFEELMCISSEIKAADTIAREKKGKVLNFKKKRNRER